jgi:1-deoxy-D-xylulose-5-phosphate reductoisomerase
MKKISILGASGSIGSQALEVIRNNPAEFALTSVSVGKNIQVLINIIEEFSPKLVSVMDDTDAATIQEKFPGTDVYYGVEGLDMVAGDDSDMLLTAVMGSVGLAPTLTAINKGKDIALANKETLVAAGEIVMQAAREKNVNIIPVDSEHSAIFQCLRGESKKEIKKIILTASGGSFRDFSRDELKNVTKEQALLHPNWAMGEKITIDSATMMNKGLEVIEAKWLFDLEVDQISTILHRESTIHSMVEFIDNSIMAQMGNSDMKTAIQFAFSYPHRLAMHNPFDFSELTTLNFKEMDYERFRLLDLSYQALKVGGTMPAVMNASNEYAVSEFLKGRISFLDIEKIVELRMEQHQSESHPDLETILYYDRLYKSDMR